MKKTVAKKSSERSIAATLLSSANSPKMRRLFIALCAIALLISVVSIHIETRVNLQKSCVNVAEGFTSIMESYKHSYRLFEKLLQREIAHADSTDEIEAFLKEQDNQLLEIEGGDYDGVYMYYRGRYLYSWSTPYEVYQNSGYDATKRPWYIGAVEAGGDIFFSVPYPSYANDYMLATISRLQPDGETVIAYDIKLGEIGKYVDKLDLYNGALTLICDAEGNIIGSTEHLYQGGNYNLSRERLEENIALAESELEAAVGESGEAKAVKKAESAKAQYKFCSDEYEYLMKLLKTEGRLRYNPEKLVFGYAYSNDIYTCFVIAPVTKLLPRVIVLWAALSFFLILAAVLVTHMLGRNNQILSDALTGLNNRRALMKYCNNHIMYHPDDDLCLMMFDLNDFKLINDRSGHVTGDHALLDTADALRQACAEAPCSFFLCRYGGDEFLLAGENCGAEDIVRTKNLINQKLEMINRTCSHPYVLEASIGVANGKCKDKAGLENLMELADKAMYEEKALMKSKKHADSSENSNPLTRIK